MSKSPFKSAASVLGFALLLYVANWLAVQWGWNPFLYCWGRGIVWQLYEPVAFVFNLAAIGFFIFRLLRGDYVGAFVAAILVLIAFGLPQFGTTLFSLGASCG